MKRCDNCGNEIVGRTKRARFCTPACKEKWFSLRDQTERAIKRSGRRCLHCDKALLGPSGKAKTCSQACSVAWQNERRQMARRTTWAAVKKPCPVCDKDIPDSRRIGSVYCSAECKKRSMDRRWRERSPGYMRQYLYGITPEQYAALLESQDGRCAICRSETPGGKGGWHVDHDHATGAIRGLLCHNCNTLLGNAKDDPARLQAAITYLS